MDDARDKKMAVALRGADYPNEEILRIARAFTTQESTVIDAGAHIGTFAVPVSQFVKEVIAFEPSAETFATLVRNAAQNNRSIDARNKALGAREARGSLVQRSAANAGAHSLMPGDDVAVGVLDKEVSRADFIKIDVEGMEAEVLAGGAALIAKSRPVVFFELNLSQLRAHGASPRGLARFFVTRGYRLYLPVEKTKGVFGLARVRSLTLMTALIAPRAWLLHAQSAPFDILAVPAERPLPLPCGGFAAALWHALAHNSRVRAARLRAYLRRIF